MSGEDLITRLRMASTAVEQPDGLLLAAAADRIAELEAETRYALDAAQMADGVSIISAVNLLNDSHKRALQLESDLNAIRGAYLDAAGTLGTLPELVAAVRTGANPEKSLREAREASLIAHESLAAQYARAERLRERVAELESLGSETTDAYKTRLRGHFTSPRPGVHAAAPVRRHGG